MEDFANKEAEREKKLKKLNKIEQQSSWSSSQSDDFREPRTRSYHDSKRSESDFEQVQLWLKEQRMREMQKQEPAVKVIELPKEMLQEIEAQEQAKTNQTEKPFEPEKETAEPVKAEPKTVVKKKYDEDDPLFDESAVETTAKSP